MKIRKRAYWNNKRICKLAPLKTGVLFIYVIIENDFQLIVDKWKENLYGLLIMIMIIIIN